MLYIVTISNCFNMVLTFFILFAVLGLTVFEKSHRITSSLVMTIFWPIYLLAMIPELLHVIYYFNQLDLLEVVSILSSFGITIVLIVVNCFSDITGLELENCQKEPPKDLSSFVSGLVFGWFEPIVVNGYRKILRQKDLPAAPDYLDVSENVENGPASGRGRAKDAGRGGGSRAVGRASAAARGPAGGADGGGSPSGTDSRQPV